MSRPKGLPETSKKRIRLIGEIPTGGREKWEVFSSDPLSPVIDDKIRNNGENAILAAIRQFLFNSSTSFTGAAKEMVMVGRIRKCLRKLSFF